jgi:hypothetical protein
MAPWDSSHFNEHSRNAPNRLRTMKESTKNTAQERHRPRSPQPGNFFTCVEAQPQQRSHYCKSDTQSEVIITRVTPLEPQAAPPLLDRSSLTRMVTSSGPVRNEATYQSTHRVQIAASPV